MCISLTYNEQNALLVIMSVVNLTEKLEGHNLMLSITKSLSQTRSCTQEILQLQILPSNSNNMLGHVCTSTFIRNPEC